MDGNEKPRLKSIPSDAPLDTQIPSRQFINEQRNKFEPKVNKITESKTSASENQKKTRSRRASSRKLKQQKRGHSRNSTTFSQKPRTFDTPYASDLSDWDDPLKTDNEFDLDNSQLLSQSALSDYFSDDERYHILPSNKSRLLTLSGAYFSSFVFFTGYFLILQPYKQSISTYLTHPHPMIKLSAMFLIIGLMLPTFKSFLQHRALAKEKPEINSFEQRGVSTKEKISQYLLVYALLTTIMSQSHLIANVSTAFLVQKSTPLLFSLSYLCFISSCILSQQSCKAKTFQSILFLIQIVAGITLAANAWHSTLNFSQHTFPQYILPIVLISSMTASLIMTIYPLLTLCIQSNRYAHMDIAYENKNHISNDTNSNENIMDSLKTNVDNKRNIKSIPPKLDMTFDKNENIDAPTHRLENNQQSYQLLGAITGGHNRQGTQIDGFNRNERSQSSPQKNQTGISYSNKQ